MPHLFDGRLEGVGADLAPRFVKCRAMQRRNAAFGQVEHIGNVLKTRAVKVVVANDFLLARRQVVDRIVRTRTRLLLRKCPVRGTLEGLHGTGSAPAMPVSSSMTIERFPNPVKRVSCFGLDPSVYQSGPTPARHGHITKRGRSYARAMLVEAVWGVTQAPGPLHCAASSCACPARPASMRMRFALR